MAPRAIGLGVTQITFIVVTALASLLGDGAVSDFNFAFALLQIPLGIIGVPLGIVVLPTLSRDAAVGREDGVRVAADPRPAAAHLRDGPDRGADRGRPPAGRRCSVRWRQHPPGRPRPHRGHARRVLDRADRARAHRRPGPGVLRAPGHGHAGRRGGRRGRDQLHARGRPGRAARACRASPSPSPSPPGSRPSRCWRSCTGGCRTSSSPASGGSASRRSSAASSAGLVVRARARRGQRRARRRARADRRSLVEAAVVSLAFGAVYAGVSLALRIPELPSIVGVMADLLRRPVRS